MSIERLWIGEPFFSIQLLKDEPSFHVQEKTIILNLSQQPIAVRSQEIGALQSVILKDTEMHCVQHAVAIERTADVGNDDELLARIRQTWPSAFDIRGEERLRGVEHYMSPKVWVGQHGFSIYHSASVPLKVGLHKDHAFCPVPGFREIHTQIVGFGKMQQCRECDVDTLYLEECMAPGMTHRPMYDAEGRFPWHQYETITPSVFLAVEMLPEGAVPPVL